MGLYRVRTAGTGVRRVQLHACAPDHRAVCAHRQPAQIPAIRHGLAVIRLPNGKVRGNLLGRAAIIQLHYPAQVRQGGSVGSHGAANSQGHALRILGR
ncbi:hypothetical protein [Deinococcus radiophilus]|uniref:hypothetical protein n=1 Tax=Deinococcus radiophilus TaxID=32062 RepID=UPI00361E405D